MATGGTFGNDPIRHFNGNLFEDAAVIHPTPGEISSIKEAARLDWSQVDPSILGTLFERGLDPDKRSQLGAHYTAREMIMMIVDPVITRPWLAEWETTKGSISDLMQRAQSTKNAGLSTRWRNEATAIYRP